MPKGSDEGLIEKMNYTHTQKNKFFKYSPLKPKVYGLKLLICSPGSFGIEHFAGYVEYTIDGFLEKNRNTLNVDLLKVMLTSELPLIPFIFNTSDASTQKVGSRTKVTNTKITLCGNFKRELQILSKILNESERHYVRCIKPNDEKAPNNFVAPKVLHQLRWFVKGKEVG